MTTTTFQHGTPQQINARLQETLDMAAEQFRRPPSVAFVLTSLRETHSFSVFTVTSQGTLECIDLWMRNHRNWHRRDWVHGRGFVISPGNLDYTEAIERAASSNFNLGGVLITERRAQRLPDIRRVKCPKCGAPSGDRCHTTTEEDLKLVEYFKQGASRDLHWACRERAAAAVEESP